MSTAPYKRHRTNRLGTFALPPGQLARVTQLLRSREVVTRIVFCLIAALAMWSGTRAWSPPFSYRTGYMPARDLYVRTEFKIPNPRATAELREQRRRETPWVYVNDPAPLLELRQRLKERVSQLALTESYEKIEQPVWREFFPDPQAASLKEDRPKFELLREALGAMTDPAIMKLDAGRHADQHR